MCAVCMKCISVPLSVDLYKLCEIIYMFETHKCVQCTVYTEQIVCVCLCNCALIVLTLSYFILLLFVNSYTHRHTDTRTHMHAHISAQSHISQMFTYMFIHCLIAHTNIYLMPIFINERHRDIQKFRLYCAP